MILYAMVRIYCAMVEMRDGTGCLGKRVGRARALKCYWLFWVRGWGVRTRFKPRAALGLWLIAG